MDSPLLSFRVLALGPFGTNPAAASRESVTWFKDESIDEIVGHVGVSVRVEVPRTLHEDGYLELSIGSYKDFRPDRIVSTNMTLKNIVEARDLALGMINQGVERHKIIDRLKQVPELTGLDLPISTKTHSPQQKVSSSVEELLKIVALGDEQKERAGKNKDIINAIDKVLQGYLEAIYSSRTFRSLEATWGGAKLLWDVGRGIESVELGLIDIGDQAPEEILDILVTSLPLDLPSLIIFDWAMDNSARSLGLLERIAELCDTMLVPGIVEISPRFFQLDRWEEIEKRPYLPHYLEEQAFAKWQSLKRKSGSRWLCAACNRVLARLPYGGGDQQSKIPFAEKELLWLSPVWALAALAAKSTQEFGWPSRMTDWKNCVLEDLPVWQVNSKMALPTEAVFTQDRITQFARAGIVALCSVPNRDFAFVAFDNMVGGASLGYQLLLTMTAQFLMWCKDNFAERLSPEELRDSIEGILILAWQKRGYDMTEKITVSVTPSPKEEKYIVGVKLDLPRNVLRGEDNSISLEIPW